MKDNLQSSASKKKAYNKPELKHYGSVVQNTKSGSGIDYEPYTPPGIPGSGSPFRRP